MADVARLAGVSHQTVSRVVNGQTNLRPETRERVRGGDPAARLPPQHRRPGAGHPALGHHRRDRLQERLLGPQHRAPHHPGGRPRGGLLRQLRQPAEPHPRGAGRRDQPPARPERRGDRADRRAPTRRSRSPAPRRTCGIPVVVVEGDEAKTRWSVGVDQVAGAALGTRHLIDLGHTDIVHLGRPAVLDRGAAARLLGWRRRCTPPGCGPRSTVDGRLVGRAAATRPGSSIAAAPRRHRRLLRQRPDGAGPAPRAVRGRPLGARATSASSASTTSRRRRT